jgi:hypothetical protein
MIPSTFTLGPLEQDLEAAGAQAFSTLRALWHEEHMRRLSLLPDGATADEHRRAAQSVTPGEPSTTRLDACVMDVVAFAPAVRHLQHVGHSAQLETATAWARLREQGTTDETTRAANAAWRPGQAFVASIKAMHFLIRALQDAAYVVLTEVLTEKHAARRSSMNSAAENESDPVRTVLDERAKGYVEWFHGHRALRNRFKEGILTGVAYGTVRDSPAILMTAGRSALSLDVIDDALRQSIAVVAVIISESEHARTARTQRASMLRDFAEHLEAGLILPTDGDLAAFCETLRPPVQPRPSRQETITRILSRLRRLNVEVVREATLRACNGPLA